MLIYEFDEFGTNFGRDGLSELGVVVGAFSSSGLFVINRCRFVFEGKCQLTDVIYKATVTSTSNDVKQYIGSTSRNFKRRLYEHKTSFPSNTGLVKPKNCTELANYLLKLKDNNTQYNTKWKMLHRTRPA